MVQPDEKHLGHHSRFRKLPLEANTKTSSPSISFKCCFRTFYIEFADQLDLPISYRLWTYSFLDKSFEFQFSIFSFQTDFEDELVMNSKFDLYHVVSSPSVHVGRPHVQVLILAYSAVDPRLIPIVRKSMIWNWFFRDMIPLTSSRISDNPYSPFLIHLP